jgi:hypothetical protein
MKKFARILLAGALSSAVYFAGASARASSIASIEAAASGALVSLGTQTDNPAVITYIPSVAGSTVDGYSYTNWSILTNDGTGSLDLFGHFPSGDTYVPTVGDAVTASGTNSPFDGIPEVGSLTAISKVSGGNAVPAPTPVTVAQLNALAGTANYNISEYLLALNNVTLSGLTAFPTHANGTLTATDSLFNSITVFQWASSYSAAGALGGLPVPTGPVNLVGICDVFTPTGGQPSTEFIPFSITAVPEPTSLSLIGIGAFGLLARRRRDSK